MTATIESLAYVKIFLHSAKYSTSSIGGYLIGMKENNVYNITDVVPICHACPCGPMFEISAEMVGQKVENLQKLTTIRLQNFSAQQIPKQFLNFN